VSVSAAFTVSASVAVFDVPTGTDGLATSETVKLSAAGLPTDADEQLYVVLESGHDHVPGALTIVAAE
jgi:hypothetical protein